MESLLPPPERLVLSENAAENWKKLRQRIELYFKATPTAKPRTKAQKAALFLHVAGQEAIDIFNTFGLSAEEQEDYDAVVLKFEDYCTPRRNETFERYVFRSRQQQEGEPFEQFLRDVQLKAQTCNSGELKDSLVRDQLVCGTADTKLRTRLLREKDLTLDKAIEFCKAAELAALQNRTWEKKDVKVTAVQKHSREQRITGTRQGHCRYCNRSLNADTPVMYAYLIGFTS